jgi:hypothetical protein
MGALSSFTFLTEPSSSQDLKVCSVFLAARRGTTRKAHTPPPKKGKCVLTERAHQPSCLRLQGKAECKHFLFMASATSHAKSPDAPAKASAKNLRASGREQKQNF